MFLFGFGLVWNVFDWIVYCVNTFAKNYKDLDRLTHTKLVLIKIIMLFLWWTNYFAIKKINTSGYAQDGWNYLFLKLKVIIRIKMYNFKFHICFFVQRTIIGIYLRERKLNFSYTYFCDMHRVNTVRFPDIVVLVWLGFFSCEENAFNWFQFWNLQSICV